MSKASQYRRTCGTRLSFLDGAVLLVCALVTWVLKPMLPEIVLFPIVLGHFFLFCNIFRIGTSLELVWSGVLGMNVVFWAATEQLSWLSIVAVQTPFTIGVLALAMLNTRYHGLGCAVVNRKNIQAWLDGEID